MAELLVRTNPRPGDTELTELARPIITTWQAAIMRVAASHANPTDILLPTAQNTPEAIALKAFKKLPDRRKDQAGRRALEMFDRPKRERRFASLMTLDLRANVSVEAMALPAKVPFTRQKAAQLVDQVFDDFGLAPTKGAALPFNALALDMQRIRCIDETDGIFGTEKGSDEIELSGFGIGSDSDGQPKQIRLQALGDFDDGTVRDFVPPRSLLLLPLVESNDYPKSFFVTMFLNEADGGGFSEFMSDIMRSVSDAMKPWVLAVLGGLSGGVLGAILGLLVAYTVRKIVEFIIGLWGDDLFDPTAIELHIKSPVVDVPSASDVVTFTGPGEYALRYEWRLTQSKPAHQPRRHRRIPPGGKEP